MYFAKQHTSTYLQFRIFDKNRVVLIFFYFQLTNLECENVSLVEQVGACHQEEEQLAKQLFFLNEKFSALEKTLQKMVEKEKESQTTNPKVLKASVWLLASVSIL